jgi:Ca-activated chloride channel family protein
MNKYPKILLLITLLAASLLHADGFIVVPPPPIDQRPRPVQDLPSPYPLEVKYHHVETAIDEMTAVTSIDQEFYNPTSSRLEGYYLFPIPEGAVISAFSMYINGKETPAEMLDAFKARSIYEDLVRKIIDPALLEYYQQGMFKARIFPIDPHSAKRVRISYKQSLERNNGTIAYTYPLNTEKFSSAPIAEVSVKVTIRTKENLKNVYCLTHEAEIIRKNGYEAVIGYEVKNAKPDRDFSVFYTTDNSKFGISILTYREQGANGYFFLNISPDYSMGKENIQEKDIAFVLDVSGSMAGQKLDQAKKALRFCVANLNKGDRFEIIRFSTEAEALFGGIKPIDSASRQKANRFIDDLRAIGGTNIEEALTLALAAKLSAARPYTILFITDGKPTIGKTGEDELLSLLSQKNSAKTRIFTFGIGDDLNTHLLDKLTETTGAYRTYVTPEEDIEVKVSDLYTKVQSPVFTGLSLDFGKGIDAHLLYPKTLPDLFRGSSVTVLGKYRGHGAGRIALKGNVRGITQTMTYDAEFPRASGDNTFIASLWAARRIGFLLDQIRLNGEDKELVDEVTSLAKTHGIITPYTSYLIVEDEDRQVRQNRLPEERRSLSSVTKGIGSGFAADKKMEYESMKEKSGAPSARASSEIQALARSYNSEQLAQGKTRLAYTAKDGSRANLTDQVRTVKGKTFYQNGSQWTDILVQKAKGAQQKRRIQFGSSGYFDLLKKTPEAGYFLALGKNVTFVLKTEVIEIYE